MRNARGHLCKVKMSGSEKKNRRRKRSTFPPKKKRRAKQRQEMYIKSVLNVQSCFFANQTYCCFSSFSGVAFAAQHYTISYFVRTNFKCYRELYFQPWLNLYIKLKKKRLFSDCFKLSSPKTFLTACHISKSTLETFFQFVITARFTKDKSFSVVNDVFKYS